MAQSLDYFLEGVCTQDVRKRTQTHAELVPYLQDPHSSLYCEDMGGLVDGLANWISCSNYKISLNGLEVVSILIDRTGEHFRSHASTVLPPTVERLGDSKDPVRESAEEVLIKLMSPTSPQYVFERMSGAFHHKLWRVREEVLIILQKTLNEYGPKTLSLSKLVPSICKLLEDQSIPVREAAVATLVEIYRHVGERVRSDIAKKDISQSRLKQINAKMDEVRDSGEMIATESSRGFDDVDFAKPVGVPKQSSKRMTSSTGGSGTIGRKSSMSGKTPSGTTAGAVDEEAFIKMFEDVPKVHLFSSRELSDHVNKIKDCLSDVNQDWEKRVDALKQFRGLIIAGAQDYDDFFQLLRTLESCMVTSIKDLRSSIVREACVTVAYLSQNLKNKLDRFAEQVLQPLIILIPNSVKIMATAGTVCIRFIIQHTHVPRLIPIITSNLSSKSNVIRRECCEFLYQLLHTWPKHTLERHIANLQEAIKKGICDADADARVHSRKAFWGFADHFRDQADHLLDKLDPQQQKLINGELSHSSSNSSLSNGTQKKGSRARSMSTERSNVQSSGYGRTFTQPSRQRQRVSSGTSDHTDGSRTSTNIQRSSSAVDLAGGGHHGSLPRGVSGVTRINPSTYNSLQRVQVVHERSSRPRKPSLSSAAAKKKEEDERSRSKNRIGISQSQPSSRSGSPTSRISYLSHVSSNNKPRRSQIPRSQGASREGSPSRVYSAGRERKLSGSGISRMKTPGRHLGTQPKVMAQRVLTTGQDSEQALAEALRLTARKDANYESDDAGSETSSVCSERSFTSFRGDIKDMTEILANLSSGSWADRKEGLVHLQNLLRGTRSLNRVELKKVTEVFTRMFHDPHGKVYSLFLETLIDLLNVHKDDLQEWLYVCLTRLLNKLGSDMLGSIQAKVQRALEAVRDSFPYDYQFTLLARYIVDQTQTPNLKVKVALLNYMHGLAMLMDPADLVNSSDTRLAVSRIITWTTEPKSVDVRKAAQAVLIALFNLNSPEFSMLLSGLPKTFQDGATKILNNHLRTASTADTEPLSPRNITSPATPNRYKMSPQRRAPIDDVDTENMNPEEIYNSIKKTSADIQNLSKLDSYSDDKKNERDTTSQDSGIQGSIPDIRSPDNGKRPHYNPSAYQDHNDQSINNGYNRAALAEAVFDVENELFNEAPWKNLLGMKATNEFPVDHSDEVTEILAELSNHNTRQDERKNAMLQLIKLTREGGVDMWDEHFKTILLLLLETLGDNDGHIRALSLRVLREILRHQPNRFKDYAELTTLKILEAHKDSFREVVRAAEECACALANSIPTEQCVRVLKPLIQTAEYPVNLAAIKMQTKVIEGAQKETLTGMVDDIIPGLLKGYDDRESPVRKASVFGLVAVYLIIGDAMKPQIAHLTGSKMKLLTLYIKRAQAQDNSSASTSKTASPTSTVTDYV